MKPIQELNEKIFDAEHRAVLGLTPERIKDRAAHWEHVRATLEEKPAAIEQRDKTEEKPACPPSAKDLLLGRSQKARPTVAVSFAADDFATSSSAPAPVASSTVCIRRQVVMENTPVVAILVSTKHGGAFRKGHKRGR